MPIFQRLRRMIRRSLRARYQPPAEEESEEANIAASGLIFAELCFCLLTPIDGQSIDLFKDMISCTEVLAAVVFSLLTIALTSRSCQV